MRRNIIFVTALLAAVFLCGGVYILGTIYFSTRALDRLIVLHQVQTMRGGLLHEAESVAGLLRAGDKALEIHRKRLVDSLERIHAATERCTACHHEETSAAAIRHLREEMDRLQKVAEPLLVENPDPRPDEEARKQAAEVAGQIVGHLNEMVTTSAARLEQRTRDSVGKINRANGILVGLVCVGPLLVILMAVFFIHGVNRPLTVLTDAMRRLKNGDMSVRVPDLRHEFHELGAGFNEMVSSLSTHVREMQRAEQMAALGQLSANIAHEIKNPLGAIKLTLQVLAEELTLSDEDRKLFARIEKEAQRIDTLMKDLLGFARPKEPSFRVVDVNRLLERAGVFGLQRLPVPGGAERGIEIQRELDPDLPPIFGDMDQLIQVFMNVVLNGIEAMREGGILSIRTWAEDGEVHVSVCDQGHGVPDDLKEKIFEPFFTRKPKGTGLGLAVTRQILEQHHGTICVKDAPGGGACFDLSFPAHPEEA